MGTASAISSIARAVKTGSARTKSFYRVALGHPAVESSGSKNQLILARQYCTVLRTNQ